MRTPARGPPLEYAEDDPKWAKVATGKEKGLNRTVGGQDVFASRVVPFS